MSQAMKRVVIETVVPENFKYIARDQDGSVHVFEEKPNLLNTCNTTDIIIIILN